MDEPSATVRSLEALCSATLEPFGEAWSDLDRTLWGQITSALAAAADEHEAILSDARLMAETASAPDAEPPVLYRREVARRVQAPVLDALRRLDPVTAVGSAFEEARSRAAEAIRALPPAASLPWHDPGLQAGPEDGAVRRWAKAVVRLSRRVRSGAPRPLVPVRTLGSYVLADVVAPGQAEAFADAQRAWVAWTAALERAWAEWAVVFLQPFEDLGAEASAGADEEEAPGDAPSQVISAARGLQTAFQAATEACPHDEPAQRGRDRLGKAVDRVDAHLAVAGTLVLRLAPDRARKERIPKGGPSLQWGVWYGHAVERLELHRSLLDVIIGSEDVVRRFGSQVRAGLGDDLAARCAGAAHRLREIAAELAGLEIRGDLPAALARSEEAAGAALDELVSKLPDPAAFAEGVRLGADTMVEAVHALTRRVPAVVTLHPLPTPGAALRRPADGRGMRAQEAARQAFDVLRMERIRTRPLEAIQRLEVVVGDAGGLREVVGFGCEAASTELASEEEGARDRALGLAREGLERATTAVEALSPSLDAVVDAVRDIAGEEVRGGWSRLVNRALAQRVHAQLLDARSAFTQRLRDTRERIDPVLKKATIRLRAAWARVRRSAARLLRKGRTLVGTEAVAGAAGVRSARLLAAPEKLLGELPLVYQRLFSLEPVSDSGLLAGRDAALADVEERWLRWREDEGVPLVLVGRPGVGLSSFLHVLTARMEELGAEVTRRSLGTRLVDEGPLARYLADALKLDAVETLAELASIILSAPSGTLPDIVSLEGVEHLYLRVPGGTDMVERTLTLMAETEPRIFWMVSVAQPAWQLIGKSEPTAVSQVDALELPSLDPDGLRSAVLLRHRRSGVPLVFEEPTEGRRLLRRRLRSVRGTASHQKMLEEDFFDRLHRSSDGSIRFALFQWLRTADFGSQEGKLLVHPVEPMDFSFLETLDLTQSFTLKALLEHGTLALEEHDRIFRVPRQESYQIVESLRNRYLVEPVARSEGDGGISEVTDSRRYRIPPLLEGAVAAHLARRNILH